MCLRPQTMTENIFYCTRYEWMSARRMTTAATVTATVTVTATAPLLHRRHYILCLNNVARYICAHTIRNNDRRLYAVAAAHHIDKYHFMSPKPYNAWANGHRNRKRAETKPGGRGQSIKTEYDHVSGCARERSCNLYCTTAMCTYIRLSPLPSSPPHRSNEQKKRTFMLI